MHYIPEVKQVVEVGEQAGSGLLDQKTWVVHADNRPRHDGVGWGWVGECVHFK